MPLWRVIEEATNKSRSIGERRAGKHTLVDRQCSLTALARARLVWDPT